MTDIKTLGEGMTESSLKKMSDKIKKAYDVLGYSHQDDVFHYFEEATETVPRRILTVKKTGAIAYLTVEEAKKAIESIRTILDEFEEML